MMKKKLKAFRNYIFFLLIQGARFIVFFIPWKAGAKACEYFALFVFLFLKKDKRTLYRNLDIVYGSALSAKEKKQLAKRNIRNYGRGFFEFLKFTVWPASKIKNMVRETHGLEHFNSAKETKKGVIAVTLHLSNWELLAHFTALNGNIAGAAAKRMFDPRIDKAVNSARTKTGVKIFLKDDDIRVMIKDLRQGMIFGILSDQDTSVESVYAPFLGAMAKTPSGPAVLAKKLGFTLLTVCIFRRPDNYYGIQINAPIETADKTTEQLAAEYNRQLSEFILKYPEQWIWVHRRFRMTVEKEMEEKGVKL